jgi:hypothetical protein
MIICCLDTLYLAHNLLIDEAMKDLKEKSHFPQIRLWDELVSREERGNKRSGVSHSLHFPLTRPGEGGKTAVFPKARRNQSGPSPNAVSHYETMAFPHFLENLTKAICQQAPEGDPLPKTRKTVTTFLKNNPQLEGDRYLAAMMLLCLIKYINRDPELAKATFAERLEYAGEMAAKFTAFDRLTQ